MSLLFFAIAVSVLSSLSTAPSLGRPQTKKAAFEVASVKPNRSGDLRARMEIQPGGRFTATNVSLRMLITNAYQLFNYQIVKAPDWVEIDRWEVTAKAEDGTIQSFVTRSPGVPSDTQVLLQALIEDRFKLRAHKETRELAIYNLVLNERQG
jgi:uncharacterized protein (TIGR03435 family)